MLFNISIRRAGPDLYKGTVQEPFPNIDFELRAPLVGEVSNLFECLGTEKLCDLLKQNTILTLSEGGEALPQELARRVEDILLLHLFYAAWLLARQGSQEHTFKIPVPDDKDPGFKDGFAYHCHVCELNLLSP